MARAGILYSHVATAAAKLAANGKNPTVDNVREALGATGSKSTIGPMLKRWKEENQGALSPVELGVPPALLQAVKGVYEDMQAEFQLNLDQARQVHEAQSLRTAEELQQWRAKYAALDETATALRAALDDANRTIMRLQDANQLLTVAMAGAQSDQAGLQQRLADRAAEVAALNGQLTQSRSQFDHYQESTAAQRSEERQAFEQRAARMDLELGTLRQQSMQHQANAAQLSGQLTQAALEHTRLQMAVQAAQGDAASARSDAERFAFELAEISADLERMKGKYEDITGELTSTQIALAVQLREGELSAARLVASDSQAHAHGQEKQALLHQLAVLETELRQAREMAMQQK
jgi:chromosome segregation ATPase